MVRLDSRQILETSLLDSHQLVTITYLSRHAEIPIPDAKDELRSFYNRNRKLTELHAVYVVSGELRRGEENRPKKNGMQNCPEKYRRTQLVREEELEALKKKFEVVDTCEIYCLHTKPIESLLLLYNVDRLEDEEYAMTDPERSWLSCPAAEVKRSAMFTAHPDSAKLFEKTVKAQQRKGGRKARSARTPSPGKKKGDDEKYANACAHTRLTPQKSSPKSPFQQKKEAKQKQSPSVAETTTQEENKKQRGRRIVLDETIDKTKQSKQRKPSKSDTPCPVAEKENSQKSNESEMPLKETVKKAALGQDDVFSDGASSAEEPMDINEDVAESEKEAPPPAKKHRLSNEVKTSKVRQEKLAREQSQQSKKATKKEYVTETFVDEDGFMVTKEVLKEVEVQPEEAATAGKEELKASSAPAKDTTQSVAKSATKKGRGTQSKISAFFKK